MGRNRRQIKRPDLASPSTRLGNDPPGAGIDIDEVDLALFDELEALGHRRRIVFGPEVLHPGHFRHDLPLDVAQGTNVARLPFATHLALLATSVGMSGNDRNSKCESKNE
jgi:hypothetical protein